MDEKYSNLFLSNTNNDEAYPLAVLLNGAWQISTSFDEVDFSDWLDEQGKADFAMVVSEHAHAAYTGQCPGCGGTIPLVSTDDDPEVLDYECPNCESAGSIELIPDEDDNSDRWKWN